MTAITDPETVDGWFGPGPPPALRTERLVRAYAGPPEVMALAAVDLEVSPGEFVAVVGATGSGKTTLVRILALLDRPTAGRCLLDGIDVGELSDGERSSLRAGRLGVSLGPDALLVDRSIAENLDLALVYAGLDPAQRRARIAEAVARVSLEHRSDSPVGELSVGERRRADLARSLVRTPSLLVVDEPTRELDGNAAASLIALLRELHRTGVTVIATTDDARLAGVADRALKLVRGRIEAEV